MVWSLSPRGHRRLARAVGTKEGDEALDLDDGGAVR